MRLPELDVAEQGGFAVVTLRGDCDIDVANASELGAVLIDLVSPEVRGLVVDLETVSYLDSAALRMLFGLVRRLGLSRQSLGLVVPDGSPLLRLLSVTHFDDVAVIGPTSEVCREAMAVDLTAL